MEGKTRSTYNTMYRKYEVPCGWRKLDRQLTSIFVLKNGQDKAHKT